jgi:TonB family protein
MVVLFAILAAVALQSGAFVPPVPDPAATLVPYPKAAREQQIEGEVRYMIDVDETGAVRNARILAVPRTGIGIEEEIAAALRGWTFTPARRDGAAVRGTYTGSLRLALEIPPNRGRMYAVRSAQAWEAVRRVLERLDLKVEHRDDANHIVQTKWKGSGRQQHELHIFVSPFQEPARVYVGAVTDIRNSERTTRFYHLPDATAEFYAALEKALGQPGHAIPEVSARRARVAAQLAPWYTPPSCPNEPVKPESQVLHQVKAVYQPTRVTNPTTLAGEFATTTFGATSMWRFRPRKAGDCFVTSTVSITMDFIIRR